VQTQKDHVHAYQFLMHRMTTALVVGDPSNMELPTRRGRSGLITGAVVALLVVIGFGVYGLIVPGGNTAYKQKGAILVEKESGSRYVYIDGKLMPTPNQASAMLVQGAGSKISVISRNSLAGLARGPEMGIKGAPDTVPRPNELMPGEWLLCPAAAPNGGPSMSMNAQGSPNAKVSDLFYVPVQAPDGKLFLIWRNTKFQVPDVNSLVALGLAATKSPFVSNLWLSLVESGPALSAAEIPDAGDAGLPVAGRPARIGDLFFHSPGNDTKQYYVLIEKGLAPVSATEYALMAAKPGSKPPVEIDAQSILTAPFSPDHSMLTRLPDLIGRQPLVEPQLRQVCLRQQGSGADVTTSVVLAPGADQWASVVEDGVLLPPNHGLLVAELPIPEGQKTPNRYLISDRGKRYLVPDNDSIQALGLGGVQPVPMRTEVLSTIPSGPALSRANVVVEQGG